MDVLTWLVRTAALFVLQQACEITLHSDSCLLTCSAALNVNLVQLRMLHFIIALRTSA